MKQDCYIIIVIYLSRVRDTSLIFDNFAYSSRFSWSKNFFIDILYNTLK